MTPRKFRELVWAHYKKHGRHDLPWRSPALKPRRDKTLDTYKVLVSEVMLQQTQVERVIPFYKKFIKQFPTAKKLAESPLPDVLRAWQGLGYNRRAKTLRAAAQALVAAKTIARAPRLRTPELVAELEMLPGVGPYTARAVAAFAYNLDVVFVETNIRTAVIHHFFPKKKKVSDTAIEKILTKVLPKGNAREWHGALMDYGAYLKRSGISHNAKSMTYAKQSKFAGSLRQARGAVLRAYTRGVTSRAKLLNLLDHSRHAQALAALRALEKEGLLNTRLR